MVTHPSTNVLTEVDVAQLQLTYIKYQVIYGYIKYCRCKPVHILDNVYILALIYHLYMTAMKINSNGHPMFLRSSSMIGLL